jgi:type VI protein secretion system component VasF
MIPDGEGKPESNKMDPEQMTRLLELELAQKREAWAQAGARRQKIRTASFLFLAIIVLGAMVAFFLLFTRLTQERSTPGSRSTPSSTPG